MAKPQTKSAGGKKNTKTVKRRERKNVPSGLVKVNTGFNNTHITITDPAGNTLCWGTCGAEGFKGSRKSTPFAAQVATETAARKAVENCNMREVDVEVTGPGSGRESALRALQAAGLVVKTIRDITPMPHNGVRPRKRRRV